MIVLIPAHNESSRIHDVVTGARKYLPVLVIDDGSTDNTAEIATHAGVRVIRQMPNQGKGAALINGLTTCLEEGYEAVITIDGDGQHDPEEIPSFLKTYEQGKVDLIIGKRDFSKMPLRRRIPNSVGKFFFSNAVGQNIPDNQSGYRLIHRTMIEKILKIDDEKGFEFEVDMLVLCLKNKMILKWVPIKTIYGDEKSHIKPMHHLVNFFRIVKKARIRMHSPD